MKIVRNYKPRSRKYITISTNCLTDKQIHRLTDRQTDWQTERQADRQTDRQIIYFKYSNLDVEIQILDRQILYKKFL